MCGRTMQDKMGHKSPEMPWNELTILRNISYDWKHFDRNLFFLSKHV